jgi:hypothetical protein
MIGALLKEVKADAQVINVSYGTRSVKPGNAAGAAAFRKFFQKMAQDHPGTIFVCAAMNNGSPITQTNNYPAGAASGLANVITVGNVMNDGSKADSSNYAGAGGEVTISAPGYQAVRGTDANGNPIIDTYQFNGEPYGDGGTSMATPQVASAAAVLKSLNSKLTAAQIKQILVETARPGPDKMGGILAIDEAVFKVISDLQPDMTREELEGRGVIDAVAASTDQPNVYSVRAILAVVPKGGTQVTITASGGVTVESETARTVAGPAADEEWPTVTVPNSTTGTGSDAAPTVTVTRKDSGASSVISFEKIDLNGQWKGTFTITEISVTGAEAKKSAEEQGCSPASMATLKNTPLPLTMDIAVDDSGGGASTMVVDTSSLVSASGGGVGSTPQTYNFTFADDVLTFQFPPSSEGTTTMTGKVSKRNGSLVIAGDMAAVGTGFSIRAVWTVTKQQ